MDSIVKKELYVMELNTELAACVILNFSSNDGYKEFKWEINFSSDDMLVPHALAVNPKFQNMSMGKNLVDNIIKIEKKKIKKQSG